MVTADLSGVMMKRLALFTIAGMLTLASVAQADESTSYSATPFGRAGRFGLGVGTGTLTTGVTGKVYLNDRVAIQALVGLGYGFSAGTGVDLNVDGIYEMPKIWGNNVISINWQLGGGAAFGFYSGVGHGTGIGIEAIGGAGLQLLRVPLEFVLDIRPTVLFGSGYNTFYFGAGASARYFF
jgi:hypothetical protein